MSKTPSAMLASLFALLLVPACDKGEDEPKDGAGKAPAEAKADGGEKKEEVADGRVFFVAPADGATVPATFEVEFGLEGKQVRPAGATERDPEFGHHHLLVDTGPIEDMKIIPKDETHIHYGDGATKATVKLAPGKHELTMQLADGAHRSYGPDWAATITVEVQDEAADAGVADEGAADAGDDAAPVADEGGEAG